MFIGTYEVKLNKKNQYKLPKPILHELKNRKTEKRIIIYAATDTSICAYAEKDIHKYFEKISEGSQNQDIVMMRRITAQFGEASYGVFGATQIPELFMKHIKIKSPTKLILSGYGDYFAITEDPRMVLRDIYL